MNHTWHVAGRIARAGIEPVGVGILDESIREVAAESIVIGNPDRHPTESAVPAVAYVNRAAVSETAGGCGTFGIRSSR